LPEHPVVCQQQTDVPRRVHRSRTVQGRGQMFFAGAFVAGDSRKLGPRQEDERLEHACRGGFDSLGCAVEQAHDLAVLGRIAAGKQDACECDLCVQLRDAREPLERQRDRRLRSAPRLLEAAGAEQRGG
jgi:hypothetical protein